MNNSNHLSKNDAMTRRKLLTSIGLVGTAITTSGFIGSNSDIPPVSNNNDKDVGDLGVNIKDFGAKCDGVTDDTEAVRLAFAFAEKNLFGIYVPGVAVISGEIEIKAPMVVSGAGAGGGYGPDALTKYRQISGFLVKGKGQKRLRTRRLYRGSAADAEDAPLSVALNVQSENVTFRDFTVFLDFDRNDNDPNNYGADWDCGIFVGCRSHFFQQNVHVLGYWRLASWYFDVTYGAGFSRFTDLNNKPYNNKINISGADGCTMIKCFCMGGKWGVFVGGALAKDGEKKYGPPYYDEVLKKEKQDNRGAFGFSDFTTFACSFYGTEHHSRYRRDKATGDFLSDTAGGVMYVDGLAGNGSGRIQGHRHISTRFASWEPFTVKLDRTQRDEFIGCHFESRTSSKIFNKDGTAVNFKKETYGLITTTDRTNHLVIIGVGGTIDKKYINKKIAFHNFFPAGAIGISETTDSIKARSFRPIVGELDLRSNEETDAVNIRNGNLIKASFKKEAVLLKGDVYVDKEIVSAVDQNSAQQTSTIPDAVLNAWEEVNFSQFKITDELKEQGKEVSWHMGVVVKQIQDSFKKHGLNVSNYNILCYHENNKDIVIGIRYQQCFILELALLRRELKKVKAK